MKRLLLIAALAPTPALATIYDVEQASAADGYRLCEVGSCARLTRKVIDVPEPAKAAAAKPAVVIPEPIRLDIMYQLRSAWIGPLGQSRLKVLAGLAGTTGHLQIEGTTDALGKARVNRALAQRRADAVRRLLIEYGVSPAQIKSASTCCIDNPPLVNPGVRRAVVVLQLPAAAATQEDQAE